MLLMLARVLLINFVPSSAFCFRIITQSGRGVRTPSFLMNNDVMHTAIYAAFCYTVCRGFAELAHNEPAIPSQLRIRRSLVTPKITDCHFVKDAWPWVNRSRVRP